MFFVYLTFLLHRCKFYKHFSNFWKTFPCITEDLLLAPNIDKVVSQPFRVWKKGRVFADINPGFYAILWIAIYSKSFPFWNSICNLCKLVIQWYTHIAITTISLSTILMSMSLFYWDKFFAWSNMRSA